MKQHIAIEQLKELTPKQMDKFLAYMNDKDYMPHGSQMMLHNDGWYMAQFLNIGQMIEFLQNNGSHWWRLQENEVNVFVGEMPKDYEGSYTYFFNGDQYYGHSVCDALWEAVKEVLEMV